MTESRGIDWREPRGSLVVSSGCHSLGRDRPSVRRRPQRVHFAPFRRASTSRIAGRRDRGILPSPGRCARGGRLSLLQTDRVENGNRVLRREALAWPGKPAAGKPDRFGAAEQTTNTRRPSPSRNAAPACCGLLLGEVTAWPESQSVNGDLAVVVANEQAAAVTAELDSGCLPSGRREPERLGDFSPRARSPSHSTCR